MPRAGASLEQRLRWMRERHSPEESAQLMRSAETTFGERHYSPAELAERWNISVDLVRRIFQNEPGVLVFGEANGGRGKRRYATLRIPESVAQRVYRRRLVVGRDLPS